MTFSDLQPRFYGHGHDYATSNNLKMVQDDDDGDDDDRAILITYNSRPIESRIWSIERRHFQWPWTTPTPGLKVTPFFDAEYLRNGTRYRDSFLCDSLASCFLFVIGRSGAAQPCLYCVYSVVQKWFLVEWTKDTKSVTINPLSLVCKGSYSAT